MAPQEGTAQENPPLYALSNVVLTPRLAGPLGGELERIGRSVISELERLLSGHPMLHRVLETDLGHH